MRIGTLIRRWRTFEERTVRDVAKELGISSSTLSRLENGENVDGETLAAVLLWVLGKTDRRKTCKST